MIGRIVGLVLGVVVIGVVVVGFLAIVPTPATCTPDATVPATTDVQARWDAYAAAPPPATVTITEGEATALVQAQVQRENLAIKDPVVHFCSDGTAQLSFTYPVGPLSIKGVATGTVKTTSPVGVSVTSILVGGLPAAVTDPVVGAVKDIADKGSSLGLAGPVGSVQVSQGQVTVSQ